MSWPVRLGATLSDGVFRMTGVWVSLSTAR